MSKTERRIKPIKSSFNEYYDLHKKIEEEIKKTASINGLNSNELDDAIHYLRNSQLRLEESLMWLNKYYQNV